MWALYMHLFQYCTCLQIKNMLLKHSFCRSFDTSREKCQNVLIEECRIACVNALECKEGVLMQETQKKKKKKKLNLNLFYFILQVSCISYGILFQALLFKQVQECFYLKSVIFCNKAIGFPTPVRTRVLYSYKNKLCTLIKGTLMK